MLKIKSLLSAPISDEDHLRMEVNPLTLAFSGRCAGLEKPFLETYAHSTLLQVRMALILSFAFYALFGALDAVIAMEMKQHFWYIRYGVVCPLILLVFGFSFSPHFPKYMQETIVALMLISGLGIIYMTAMGNALTVRSYYVGLLLVLMVV